MEKVYVVFDGEYIILGIFRTFESAKRRALEEIEYVCNESGFDEKDKSNMILQLNDDNYVDEIVCIDAETLYD